MIPSALLTFAALMAGDTVPEPRVSVYFVDTPIEEVVLTFADFAGRSIVFGPQVTGLISAEIRDQPWRDALQAILQTHGFALRDGASGILHVDLLDNLLEDRRWTPIEARVFPVQFGAAADYEIAVRDQLSPRGSVSVAGQGRWLLVRDAPDVLDRIDVLMRTLEKTPREITISATLLFVNRSRLGELGIAYELSDAHPRAALEPSTGVPEVGLRGPALAALGNANQRVSLPSLRLLVELLTGRYRLLAFAEALESAYLSEVEASPKLRVLEHHTARILVGERVPLPVYRASMTEADGWDARIQGAPFGVQFQDVGIRLEVTPRVTDGDLILMDVHAERSGVEVSESSLGFIFNTQEASTRVRVQDRETVIMGGLTLREKAELRSGIPVLMHLPWVGRWFRLTRQEAIQRDLIILITPSLHPPAPPGASGVARSGHPTGGSPP